MFYKRCLLFYFCFFGLTVGQYVLARGNSLADYKPGFYIGGKFGYARLNERGFFKGVSDAKDLDLSSSVTKFSSNRGKIGGGFDIGYSFTPYFSLEVGPTFFQGNKYDIEAGGESGYIKIDVWTINIMAKGILPLEELSPSITGWNLYAKLGAVIPTTKGSIRDNIGGVVISSSKTTIKPGGTIGIGYNFTDHFGMDLSWSAMYGTQIDRNEIVSGDNYAPSIHLVALGFTYKF